MSPFRILDCGLLLPLNLKSKTQNPKSLLSEAGSFLDLDRVALHLVVEGGTLDTETFGSLLLVPVTFCKRLNNRVSLDIIETLHARSREGATLCLLRKLWKLNFGGQLLHTDHPLPRQHHRIGKA